MTLVYKRKTEEKKDDSNHKDDNQEFFNRVKVPAYVEGLKQKILENRKIKRCLSSSLYNELLAELCTVINIDCLDEILCHILVYLKKSELDNEIIWKQLILVVEMNVECSTTLMKREYSAILIE